MRWFDD